MHERSYETSHYKIIAYMQNAIGNNINVCKCVEIRNCGLVIQGFTRTDNLYFPDHTLNDGNNILHIIVIEFCNTDIVKVLKKILPTVFNNKHIRLMNQTSTVSKNVKLIKHMVYNILGDHPVLDTLNQYKSISQEDAIFNEDEVFGDEDYLDVSL